MLKKSCQEFIDVLASSEPVPGGGGAAAYAGALGVALGSMVANLTVGKKKYAEVQEDIALILDKATGLQNRLASLVQRDAEVFEPLSKAYSLPKETAEQQALRNQVMEEALLAASLVPLEIMEQAYQGLLLHAELAKKGSRLALSDVGVGAQMLRAAILGGAMNIFINIKSMKNRSQAEEIRKKAEELISGGAALADEIYRSVEEAIR